jgi:hypothetical protein
VTIPRDIQKKSYKMPKLTGPINYYICVKNFGQKMPKIQRMKRSWGWGKMDALGMSGNRKMPKKVLGHKGMATFRG